MPDNGFQVIPLRAFTDNYVWTLRNAACAAVVDPGEARPVLDYLAAEKLRLVAILATHHHPDHVAGIAEILQTHAVPVYGPRGEPITTLTHPVGGGDRVAVEQPPPPSLDDRPREGHQPLAAREAARGNRIGKQIPGEALQRSRRSIRRATPVEERILNRADTNRAAVRYSGVALPIPGKKSF